MTETYVEDILIQKFLSLGSPWIKTEIKDNVEVVKNVAIPNENFTRPADGNWFEIDFLTNPPTTQELGVNARTRWRGIMQIAICVPKNTGRDALNARYNKIHDLYMKRNIFNGIRVNRVFKTSALDAGDYYVVIASVEWQSDLNK